MDVHACSRFSPGCLVVGLIYIERLRRSAGAMLLAETWQPILVTALILAQKVWEDRSSMNIDFTRLCPALTLQQLNTLERCVAIAAATSSFERRASAQPP